MKKFEQILLPVLAALGVAAVGLGAESLRVVDHLSKNRSLVAFAPAETGLYVIDKIDLSRSSADSAFFVGTFPETLQVCSADTVYFVVEPDPAIAFRIRKTGECDSRQRLP